MSRLTSHPSGVTYVLDSDTLISTNHLFPCSVLVGRSAEDSYRDSHTPGRPTCQPQSNCLEVYRRYALSMLASHEE